MANFKAVGSVDRLIAGRERARKEREERARAVLGAQASQDDIDAWVKKALSDQKSAARLQNEAKKRNKAATESLQKAQKAQEARDQPVPPPVPAPGNGNNQGPAYSAPPVAPSADTASELYGHSIFGASLRPGAVTSVELHRLPSTRVEHNVPGVSPGYLDTWEFDSFNQDSVRAKHGGGKYRAFAMDAYGRRQASGDLDISGRAKAYDAEPENPRLSSNFRPEEEVPGWIQHQDARLDRLEGLIEATLQKPGEMTAEDKFERWKKEQEHRELAEDKRHERKMAELRLALDAEREKDRQRQQSEKDALAASQKAQTDLITTMLTMQQNSQQTVMNVLLAKKDDGGSAAYIAPLITGMAEVMKVSNTQMNGMFGLIRDTMGGEDKRTIGTRMLDMVEGAASGIWNKAGDQILNGAVAKLVEGKMPGAAPAANAPLPLGQAFQLPDGRVVSPEITTDFITRYRARYNTDPTMDVCVRTFTILLNQQAQAAAGGGAVSGGPQASPPPAAGMTLEQAQEIVRKAAEKAATAATNAGRSPEEVQAAYHAAAQQAVQALRGGSPAAPVPGPSSPVPVAAPLPPTPQPTPAAIAAARAAEAALAANPPIAAQEPAPDPTAEAPRTLTMLVEAAPPATDMVSIPWMARSFLQDAIDAFQAKQDPLSFLERSLRQKKLSEDARVAIGKVYEESDDKAPISDVLIGVYKLLSARGITMPPNFVQAFQSTEGGDAWLEMMLYACSCRDIEEAKAEAKEEAEK